MGWLPLMVGLFLQGIGTLSGCTSAREFSSTMRHVNRLGTTSHSAIHDAGNVLAGTPVQHTFHVHNRSDKPIHLARREGIRMSCGCAAAKVHSHTLAPGEKTPIDVQLNTLGKRGDVSEVVTTAWTSADQSRQEYRFEVRAHVKAALKVSPPEVVFTRQDLAQGNEIRVECTSDLDLDWNQSQLISLVDGLAVKRREISAHGLTLALSFHPSASGVAEIRQGFVQLEVPRSGDKRPPSDAVRELLPVHWPSPGSTRISPSVVTFYAAPGRRRWQGWFIVAGEEMKTQESIQSIEASAARIEVRQRRLAPTAIRIDATMSLIRPVVPPRWIDIVLVSGERKRLRILYSDKPSTKET